MKDLISHILKSLRTPLTLLFTTAVLMGQNAVFAQQITPPKLPHEKYTLPNGLTVILHEDHSTPVVAVNVWYHVGSKNEKRGRTGFAHLFEHMMFQGSKNHDTDFFKALEAVGATDLMARQTMTAQITFKPCHRTRWNEPCG